MERTRGWFPRVFYTPAKSRRSYTCETRQMRATFPVLQFRGDRRVGGGVTITKGAVYLVATLSFNFVNPIVPQRAVVVALKAPRWEYALVVVGFRVHPRKLVA